MSVEIVTFGCRLNTHESEIMRSKAHEAGLTDAIVVNTCAVTAEAVRQARQTIRKLRREKPDSRIVVTGCAAQTEPATFAAMPEVDRVVGNTEKFDVAAWSDTRAAFDRGAFGIDAEEKIVVNDIMAVRETALHLIDGIEGRTRATVQIQNGCDHRCTFCIIPYGRGNSRSVPMGEIVTQVRKLVENGCREIVLTGVDITSYGQNLPGTPKLGALVKQILKHVPELQRLRLSSIDSVEADADLLDALASDVRLMPHLHLSLQAGDDMILKRMKRRHLRDDAIALLQPGSPASPRRGVRRRYYRRLSDRNRGDVRAFTRHRGRMRSHPSACFSVLAATGDAGSAHAAGCARDREGACAAFARQGRCGFEPASRQRDRTYPQRSGREWRDRTNRAIHTGACWPPRPGWTDRRYEHFRA